MLVLGRKKDETFVFDFTRVTPTDLDALLSGRSLITVTCVDIRGDKTRAGVDAPGSVQVHRREVYDAIRRDELAAAANVGGQERAPCGGGAVRGGLNRPSVGA